MGLVNLSQPHALLDSIVFSRIPYSRARRRKFDTYVEMIPFLEF